MTELVYGFHPIYELLKAGRRRIVTLYTTKPEPRSFVELRSLLVKKRVLVRYVTRETLKNVAKTTDHQSLVAWAAPYQFRKKPFEPEKQPFLLMLDGIQDPRNLGAILRTAYCTGVSGIVVTKKNSAPINAVALKASAGLAEHLEIMLVPSSVTGARALLSDGYRLYLSTLENGANALDIEYKEPLCLVIGSEGTGISKELLSRGTRITLPQRTSSISYNASVAAGLFMFLIATKNGHL